MIKTLLTALLLCAVSIPAYASSMKEIGNATYQLLVDDKMECSTTFITKTKLLTAAHCIELSGDHIYSVKRDIKNEDSVVIASTVIYAKLSRISRADDVATLVLLDDTDLLNVIPVEVATVEEANQILDFGTELISVGYPLDKGKMIVEGLFSSREKLKQEPADSMFYKTSVNIMPGASGGGLYVEIDGTWKLIGTTFAIDITGGIMTEVPISYMSYFSTIESVRKLL